MEQLTAVLEPAASEVEAVTFFEALAFQLGDAVAEQFRVDRVGDFEGQLQSFISAFGVPKGSGDISAEASGLHLCQIEVCKAKQTFVDVEMPAGPTRIPVPATTRDVLNSPHREQWIASDQRALDVLLAAGNYLRRLRDVLAEGHPVFNCVVARKLKVDKVTRKLLDLNGFKSRINLDGDQQAKVLAQSGKAEPRGAHAAVADDASIKFFCSVMAEYRLQLIIADLPNAYCLGERRRAPVAMHLPRTLDARDEDGEQMVLWLVTPVYGEGPSGDELDTLELSVLDALGWSPLDVSPAMHTFFCDVGPSLMIRTVDDFAIATPEGTDHGEGTVAKFVEAFGPGVVVKRGAAACEYAGYTLAVSDDRSRVTLRMTMHVMDAVGRFVPELLEGKRPSAELPPQQRRGALARLAEKLKLPPTAERQPRLSPEQTFFQEVTGAARYFERVKPRLTHFLWLFSRVSSYPYPIDVAKMAARLLLELAYDTREEGITFGGEGLDLNPRLAGHFHEELDLDGPTHPDLEAHADTTWNCEPDAYAAIIMRNRGALAHGVWRMTLVCDSSQLAEAVGSSRAAEKMILFREMERGVGLGSEVPTVLTTDSSSNWQVATRHASSSRSRHALRRWRVLTQRILDGDCKLVHVDGASMPADFLTKRVEQKKVDQSVAYATNARNAVPQNEA